MSPPESSPSDGSDLTSSEITQTLEEVSVDSAHSRNWLFWLQPLTAAILFVLLLAGGLHSSVADTGSVSVADREVDVLNWMYWLSLLFIAVVLGPAVWAGRERVRTVGTQLRSRPFVLLAGIYAVALLFAGTAASLLRSEPTVEPIYSLQPPVWSEISHAYVPRCAGSFSDEYCQGTLSNPLGTNSGGEDMVAVALYGLNTTLQVAVTASVIAATLGIIVGTAAGYYGNRIDELLMRYVDMQRALPAFFVYILLMLVFNRSYELLILVFGLLSWGGIARLVRSEVAQLRVEPFIRAAELSGARPGYIIVRHILPTAAHTIITAVALLFAKFAVYEAALAFLALTDPSVTSLGNEIARAIGRETADLLVGGPTVTFDWWQVPWVVYVPTFVLASLVFVVSVLGDALAEMLSPRS